MDFITWNVILITLPAVLFAGISKGGFGSGAAFASSAILALVLEPEQAVGVMLPLLMLIDVRVLPAYWNKWNLRDSLLLILAAIPGICVGALVFASADTDIIRILIGVISLLFVVWQLGKDRLPIGQNFGPVIGGICGGILGFTSYVAHAGGPLAAIYLLGRGMGKTEYQASTVLVFWSVNFFKIGIYAAIGIFTVQSLTLDLLLAPFALLGAWMGIRLHHIIPERVFFILTYILLTVTGTKLVWDGIL